MIWRCINGKNPETKSSAKVFHWCVHIEVVWAESTLLPILLTLPSVLSTFLSILYSIYTNTLPRRRDCMEENPSVFEPIEEVSALEEKHRVLLKPSMPPWPTAVEKLKPRWALNAGSAMDRSMEGVVGFDLGVGRRAPGWNRRALASYLPLRNAQCIWCLAYSTPVWIVKTLLSLTVKLKTESQLSNM